MFNAVVQEVLVRRDLGPRSPQSRAIRHYALSMVQLLGRVQRQEIVRKILEIFYPSDDAEAVMASGDIRGDKAFVDKLHSLIRQSYASLACPATRDSIRSINTGNGPVLCIVKNMAKDEKLDVANQYSRVKVTAGEQEQRYRDL